jgi:hypothetical protein
MRPPDGLDKFPRKAPKICAFGDFATIVFGAATGAKQQIAALALEIRRQIPIPNAPGRVVAVFSATSTKPGIRRAERLY